MSDFIEEIITVENTEFEKKIEEESENRDHSSEEKKIIMNSFEKQLCAKQDYSSTFTIPNDSSISVEGDLPVDVIVVFDGHGPSLVINIIRQLSLIEHFSKNNPMESIQQEIDSKIFEFNSASTNHLLNSFANFNTIKRSGATCSFAKVYRNIITKKVKIVAEWVGDSPILIFINDALVFQSENHNWENETEIERLRKIGVFKSLNNCLEGFKTISENKIVLKPGKYVEYVGGVCLAMTRSLGHNRVTGIEPQQHTIECTTDDCVKVVTFSDGVGDIIHLESDLDKIKKFTAEEIVTLAESRWKQTWNINESQTTFPSNGYDDCCCSVWEQN